MHANLKMLDRTLLIVLLVGFIAACAKPYYLSVGYYLPEESRQLAGQKVSLSIADRREDKSVFSEKAKKGFNLWDGTYALALDGNPPPEPVETYDLPALFYEGMKKRLEAMQIDVVDASPGDVPALILTLEKVAVDVKGKTWYMEIAYTAQLSRDSSKIAREAVSGDAERTKIMGIGGGQKLTGELFTDVINKLDIPKLFENAGLL